MIPLLPKWNLMPNRPSFYDTDSATLLELASTLHKTMNSLIEDYNKFVDNTNKTMTEFIASETKNQEVFEIAIRQEFQDFINVVDLKISGMNNTLNTMLENQRTITQDLINEAVKAGQLSIIESYDEETETLNFTATGGV